MRCATILLLSASTLFERCSGFPHDYIPPEGVENRGPCPAFNVMANHGYIPRDGKNVPVEDFLNASEVIFGAEAESANATFNSAVAVGLPVTIIDGKTTFNLYDLYASLSEHDASLLRQDEYFGPNSPFDEDLFQGLLAMEENNSGVLTRQNLADYRAKRILDSRMRNPEANLFWRGEPSPVMLSVDTVVYLMFGNDPNLDFIPIKDLRTWFEEERIPDDFVTRPELGQPLVPRSTAVNIGISDFLPAVLVALQANITDILDATATAAPSATPGDGSSTTTTDSPTMAPTTSPTASSGGGNRYSYDHGLLFSLATGLIMWSGVSLL